MYARILTVDPIGDGPLTALDWKFESRHRHAAGSMGGKLTEEEISRIQDRLLR